jgi:hypothetical protein
MYRAKTKTSKKSKKITGVFKSKVTRFYYENEHHIPDTYLIVEYKLTDASGNECNYKESFLDNGINDRALDFFDYLEENGIPYENRFDFLGREEELDIRIDSSTNSLLPTIYTRKFI